MGELTVLRKLRGLNRRGFAVVDSEQEARDLRQAAVEELNVKADAVNFGSPCHWFVFKADVLDEWIKSGILRRRTESK